MPKKRRSKPYRVQITVRDQHEVAAHRWQRWLALGLIIPLAAAPRVAKLREGVVALLSDGDLNLQDKFAPVGVSLTTNSAVIDRLVILAHGGQVPLTRDDQLRIRQMRESLEPAEAEYFISDWLRNWRSWQMRRQYGWTG